jgi:flagella basal body P-ring formation protein FlgA
MRALHLIPSVLLCLSAVLPAASAASAAASRPMTTLHAATVRLSDLFDDAGPRGGVVLGPGPAPGERIVVEAPQLAAIARQFGVNWTPASSGDRAVLDRPGRPLPREAVLAALQAALQAAGAGADCDIDIAGFNPPLVPFEANPVPVVSQLDYDAPSGRFSALLSLTAPQMDPLDLRVAGRADPTMVVPVAVARLPAGSVVQAGDLRLARLRVGGQRDAVAVSVGQAVGLTLRHQIMPGQAVPMADLVPPTLVARGGLVLMQLDSPGIALTAEGMAMESGALGAHVRVLNPISRAVVEADVIGPGQVRVDPNSLPVGLPAHGPAVAQVLR